jgi:hypothetical protein
LSRYWKEVFASWNNFLFNTENHDFVLPHTQVSYVNECMSSMFLSPHLSWDMQRAFLVFLFALRFNVLTVVPDAPQYFAVLSSAYKNVHRLTSAAACLHTRRDQ